MLRKRIFSFMLALVLLALAFSLAFARDWSAPVAQSGMGMETATAAPEFHASSLHRHAAARSTCR